MYDTSQSQTWTPLDMLQHYYPTTLNMWFFSVTLFQKRNQIGSSFTSTILCSGQYVFSCKSHGDALLLYGWGLFVTFFENSHEQFPFEKVVFKFISFSCCDILFEKEPLRLAMTLDLFFNQAENPKRTENLIKEGMVFPGPLPAWCTQRHFPWSLLYISVDILF